MNDRFLEGKEIGETIVWLKRLSQTLGNIHRDSQVNFDYYCSNDFIASLEALRVAIDVLEKLR